MDVSSFKCISPSVRLFQCSQMNLNSTTTTYLVQHNVLTGDKELGRNPRLERGTFVLSTIHPVGFLSWEFESGKEVAVPSRRFA